jgi:2,4-dienoyl-CoA reductase-like NADH-dependent reductase (Old Yellow Enzyme family)
MTKLFSPIRLAGLELANRIVVSPMCQYSADDGCANDWHFVHLGMLANSGAALLVVEATAVERRGRITHGCLGIYSDACEAALTRVIAHCRRHGTARLGIQIGHAGRKASSQRPWEGGRGLTPDEDSWETVAPSAVPFGESWPAPRQMTDRDLARVREAFVDAPVSNQRTDRYGGSLDNRLRFPLEVAAAVRAVVPNGIALGARITGSDWRNDGLTPDDAVAQARALKAAGLDFVCVSSGGVTADTKIAVGPGYQVPFAEKVRREADIPTRAVGLIATPRQAETILQEGKADMVALARAMLDDPHWGWHAAHELGADVPRPPPYARAAPGTWPGAHYLD